MGWIHLRLWLDGYREVPVIGTLFVLNAIGAGLLVAALLAVPARLRTATAALTALFTAGTAGGLILSLTVGLFGVQESLQTPLVPTTLTVESAGVLVLGLTSILGLTSPSRPLASETDAVQTTR
jgi:Ni/Fe-hydrogenase subunit HybB-like protein